MMKTHSVSSNSFGSKCLIQGCVPELKMIAVNIHKNNTDTILFHPSAIIYPEQKYADVIIANDKDTKTVNEFLNTHKAWSSQFGEFGTSQRAENIIKYLWSNDTVSTYKASDVLTAIENNKFNYNTLNIEA